LGRDPWRSQFDPIGAGAMVSAMDAGTFENRVEVFQRSLNRKLPPILR
jgi:hypothetical protein